MKYDIYLEDISSTNKKGGGGKFQGFYFDDSDGIVYIDIDDIYGKNGVMQIYTMIEVLCGLRLLDKCRIFLRSQEEDNTNMMLTYDMIKGVVIIHLPYRYHYESVLDVNGKSVIMRIYRHTNDDNYEDFYFILSTAMNDIKSVVFYHKQEMSLGAKNNDTLYIDNIHTFHNLGIYNNVMRDKNIFIYDAKGYQLWIPGLDNVNFLYFSKDKDVFKPSFLYCSNCNIYFNNDNIILKTDNTFNVINRLASKEFSLFYINDNGVLSTLKGEQGIIIDGEMIYFPEITYNR